jgi:carbamoyltransferase
VPPEKVCFAEHHQAHACYAYYGSPFRARGEQKTLVLTADAFGDNSNAAVWVVDDGGFRLKASSSNFQTARLYRSMTLLLGMKPDEHEYKVMGLAAYAKPGYFQKAFEVFGNTQYVEGLGFAYREKPPDLYEYFRDRLEGVRFDSIAGGLQKYTEDILVQWSRNALAATSANRLVFGGGIAMNVKAMMEIAKLPEVDRLFVCPSPSDESLAIGAAYVILQDALLNEGRKPESQLKPLPNAYLGLENSASDSAAVAREFKLDAGYRVHPRVDLAYVAHRLAEGKIAGRCVGRNEFGARALGNRSILADPRQPSAVRRINESVKNRDFWMPFAPTILADRADDYLVRKNNAPAPYMTVAFETRPLAQRDLIAGLHQADLTCRPQILESAQNPAYFELLKEFERITKVGGVLNTSFNLHGEPIVQTPADAARVFRLSGLDLLVLDGHVIEKRADPG